MNSPTFRLPTPATPTRRHSTARATPKLRDSCRACGSSKLKCGKEKPTCSRCAKRGLACEYVATRRGGRKHEHKPSISNGIEPPSNTISTDITTQAFPPLSDWFASDSTNSTTATLSSPVIIQHYSTPTTSGPSSSLFADFDFPLNQPLTNELDDFATSSPSFSVPLATDTDILGQAHFFNTDLDSSSNSSTTLFDTFPEVGDSISELFALPKTCSPPNSRASSTDEPQSQQALHPPDSSNSCMIRALDLIKEFSLSVSTAYTLPPVQIPTDPTDLTSIKVGIAKAERSLEAVSSMLECSCSQDGYLLSIMSLIVFKVLDCYAGAASGKTCDSPLPLPLSAVQTPLTAHSRQSSHAESSEIPSSQYFDSANPACMAAQLVLSELYRVQRFVNQLSTKLKARAAIMNGMQEIYGYENTDSEAMLPLSAAMLKQFEVDLRKRLHGLSLNIVEGLNKR
ncbi:MAG: hypothetical protein HETSPECPRED_010285 [Heterodermia speciosa]|uniref:Zn(2)-C6 fungal-type domain-containing protein n=1 Tax=Heterodermia speciosa TaxID=116794 RepID=A0A8H3G5N9_9LECA|nr:MAG: hypothetical protein HETSPECPRED_010285 [Heterodermia speciosa]